MTEQAQLYRLINPVDSVDLATQANRYLSMIADRLDALEGYRGTPTFRAEMDMQTNKIANAGDAAVNTDLVPKGQTDAAIAAAILVAKGDLFPVGAIYLTDNSTNPATLLGFGTWTQISQGQYLVGQLTADPDFGNAGDTGGAKTIDIAHTHTIAHTHDIGHTHPGSTTAAVGVATTINDGAHAGNTGASSAADSGSALSAAQSVLNPFRVIYIWKRTA